MLVRAELVAAQVVAAALAAAQTRPVRPHQVNGRQLWLAAGLALIAVIVAACVLDSPPVETTEGARCVARGGRWEPADIRKDGYCIDPPGLR